MGLGWPHDASPSLHPLFTVSHFFQHYNNINFIIVVFSKLQDHLTTTSHFRAAFVRQCWSFKSKDRASIKTIINQLQSNPILLHPCLEIPSSSSPPRSSREHPHTPRRHSRQSSQLEEVITTLPSTSQQPLLSKPSTSSPNTPPPFTPDTSSFHQFNPSDTRQALSAIELRSQKGRGFLPLKMMPPTFRNLKRLRYVMFVRVVLMLLSRFFVVILFQTFLLSWRCIILNN